MTSSTANWHWKNKTVTPWAKQWFDRELTAIRINGDGSEEVAIERVVEVDGDVELGQRKSKCVSSYLTCALGDFGMRDYADSSTGICSGCSPSTTAKSC